MDLHAGQVQGFFHVPVDHMTAMPMLTQWFADQHITDELVIVSPDAGRVKTARNFARRIGTHWAVMEKERPAQQVAEIGYVVGDVKGKTAVLVDDMIDTAGTLCAAAQTVLDEGAARVIACATHGVFSGPAYERLENSAIERIVVTDTLPLRRGWTYPKVTKDWTSKPWAMLPMRAALIAMRHRLPGLAAEKLPQFGVAAMWVYHPLVTPRLARICDLAGVELIAWTVDDAARMQKLVDAGVHGLVSNDPRLFKQLP
jgi:hypothetical protein